MHKLITFSLPKKLWIQVNTLDAPMCQLHCRGWAELTPLIILFRWAYWTCHMQQNRAAHFPTTNVGNVPGVSPNQKERGNSPTVALLGWAKIDQLKLAYHNYLKLLNFVDDWRRQRHSWKLCWSLEVNVIFFNFMQSYLIQQHNMYYKIF